MSLIPGFWLFGQRPVVANAEVLAFLVYVAEEFEGEIKPSQSINFSWEPVICKLFCTNRRCKTLLPSPEIWMRVQYLSVVAKRQCLKGWIHLEQSKNLQDSEKRETDYSHGMLCLNSNHQICKKHVLFRTAEMSVGSSKLKLAYQPLFC